MAELSVNCPGCGAPNSVPLGAEVEVYTCAACGAQNPIVESGPVEAAIDPLIGQTISECKVIEKLGEGGFGAVYKAMDQNLQRPVALKVMLQSLTSNQEFVQKFIREAITAAQLNHPNIVSIHKVGRDEKRGIHYLIMELLEGKTLQDVIEDKGILKIEEAIPIILQASEALAAAHDKKIVHRDIKPENIMVDRRGVVKIMDFGLAKVVNPDMKSTKVMGTPHYMSPEQFEGKQVDGRTDIYSLGVTFYYMLSKTRPYEGTNTVQIIYAILTSEPKSLLDANSAVPPEIWAIIQKMIAKKVDERYASLRDTRKDLLAFQEKTIADRIPCPQCGAKNVRGKKFCRQCGGNLQVKCPACGADEVAGVQTCGSCGASIETLLAVRQNLDRAKRLKTVGDLRRAYLLLKEVLKTDPAHAEAKAELEEVEGALQEVDSVRSEALELEKTGNLEDALKKVEALLGRYPAAEDIKRQRDLIKRAYDSRVIAQHMKRADESIAGGNLQAALVALDAALRLDTGREDIVVRRRDVEDRISAADDARRGARDAYEGQRYSEAFRRATEVLRANPTDAEMAQILEKCRGYLDSSEEFVRRGRDHFDAGRFVDAKKELEAAAQLRPDDAEVTALLDQLGAKLKGFREALSQAREALGEFRFADARTHVAAVLKHIPGDPESLGLMASIARQEQETRRAAEVKSALDEGEALEKSGDLEGALDAFRRAVDVDPDSSVANKARDRLEARIREASSIRAVADEHLRDGRFEDALESLQRLRKLMPDDANLAAETEEAREKVQHISTSLRKAENAAARKELRACVEAAQQVLDLSPNHARASSLKREAEKTLAAIERHVKEAEQLIASEIFDEAKDHLAKARAKGADDAMVGELEATAVAGVTAALKTEATRFYTARDYGAALDAYERILDMKAADEDARKGKNEAERRLRAMTSEPMTLRSVVAAAAAVMLFMFQVAAVRFRPPRDLRQERVGSVGTLIGETGKPLDVAILLAAEAEGPATSLAAWKTQHDQHDELKLRAQTIWTTIAAAADTTRPVLDRLAALQGLDGDLDRDPAFKDTRVDAASKALAALEAEAVQELDRLSAGNAVEARDFCGRILDGGFAKETLVHLRANDLVQAADTRSGVLILRGNVESALRDAAAAHTADGWRRVGGRLSSAERSLQGTAEGDALLARLTEQFKSGWYADLKARDWKGMDDATFFQWVQEVADYVDRFSLHGEADAIIVGLKRGP